MNNKYEAALNKNSKGINNLMTSNPVPAPAAQKEEQEKPQNTTKKGGKRENAGRKPKPNIRKYSLNINIDLIEEVDAVCAEIYTNRTDFINRAIANELKRLKEE